MLKRINVNLSWVNKIYKISLSKLKSAYPTLKTLSDKNATADARKIGPWE